MNGRECMARVWLGFMFGCKVLRIGSRDKGTILVRNEEAKGLKSLSVGVRKREGEIENGNLLSPPKGVRDELSPLLAQRAFT
jgi:hypothetical protein